MIWVALIASVVCNLVIAWCSFVVLGTFLTQKVNDLWANERRKRARHREAEERFRCAVEALLDEADAVQTEPS